MGQSEGSLIIIAIDLQINEKYAIARSLLIAMGLDQLLGRDVPAD